jgi:hypothetical protein
MKTRRLLAILAFACVAVLASCSGSEPEVTETEVLLHAGQLDVRFVRGQQFAQTYMLFGGGATSHANAISKVTLFGLPDYAARYIHAQYPDFHRCKSRGAPMAQNQTRQIDVVAANSKIQKRLKKALALHSKGIRESGERVCVTIEGEMLTLRSVVVAELDKDITHELPSTSPREYFFVTSATIGNFQEAVLGQ